MEKKFIPLTEREAGQILDRLAKITASTTDRRIREQARLSSLPIIKARRRAAKK